MKPSTSLRAMIFLGVNCGFGNADCGTLPRQSLDLVGGWVNYHRPKTGITRRCPLWPETVAALGAALAEQRRSRPIGATRTWCSSPRAGAELAQGEERQPHHEGDAKAARRGSSLSGKRHFYALRPHLRDDRRRSEGSDCSRSHHGPRPRRHGQRVPGEGQRRAAAGRRRPRPEMGVRARSGRLLAPDLIRSALPSAGTGLVCGAGREAPATPCTRPVPIPYPSGMHLREPAPESGVMDTTDTPSPARGLTVADVAGSLPRQRGQGARVDPAREGLKAAETPRRSGARGRGSWGPRLGSRVRSPAAPAASSRSRPDGRGGRPKSIFFPIDARSAAPVSDRGVARQLRGRILVQSRRPSAGRSSHHTSALVVTGVSAVHARPGRESIVQIVRIVRRLRFPVFAARTVSTEGSPRSTGDRQSQLPPGVVRGRSPAVNARHTVRRRACNSRYAGPCGRCGRSVAPH